MPKGNPNPNTKGLKPFKRGQTGNPGGKTSEQKRLELANAEAAMRIRARLLNATEAKLNEMSSDEAMQLVEAAMLKLLKDSEDRGLGSPVQPLSNPDRTLTPQFITRTIVDPKSDEVD